MQAYDLRTQVRVERHGDEWEFLDPPCWQLGREAMRSVKTGHIYWWDWEAFHRDAEFEVVIGEIEIGLL